MKIIVQKVADNIETKMQLIENAEPIPFDYVELINHLYEGDDIVLNFNNIDDDLQEQIKMLFKDITSKASDILKENEGPTL